MPNMKYTIEELFKDKKYKLLPKAKGVYIVSLPDGFDVKFKKETDGPDRVPDRSKSSEDGTRYVVVPVDELKKTWDAIDYKSDEQKIIYIGKATDLYKRVYQLVRYGYNKECAPKALNHVGGKTMWQIKDNRKLLLEFYECDNPEAEENKLIEKFKAKHNGNFPFANEINGIKKK